MESEAEDGMRKRRKGERGERKQRIRELLLDRTEIGAVYGLDQLGIEEQEDFVTDGEERHLTRTVKFCHTKHNVQRIARPQRKSRRHPCDPGN